MILVKIIWDDAVTDVGWEDVNLTKIERVSSVGWIVDENEKQIILAADISQDRDDNTHTNRRIAIPLSWVVERDDLYEG